MSWKIPYRATPLWASPRRSEVWSSIAQVGPGQFVQSGAGTPLFTIADPSSVWMLANVRETDAGSVRPGQAIEVHVLAYPNRVFKAHVSTSPP